MLCVSLTLFLSALFVHVHVFSSFGFGYMLKLTRPPIRWWTLGRCVCVRVFAPAPATSGRDGVRPYFTCTGTAIAAAAAAAAAAATARAPLENECRAECEGELPTGAGTRSSAFFGRSGRALMLKYARRYRIQSRAHARTHAHTFVAK